MMNRTAERKHVSELLKVSKVNTALKFCKKRGNCIFLPAEHLRFEVSQGACHSCTLLL